MKQIRNFAIALAFAVFLPVQALAEPVDLELVLAVDVSGSVNTDRYLAQKQGYIAALPQAGDVAARPENLSNR